MRLVCRMSGRLRLLASAIRVAVAVHRHLRLQELELNELVLRLGRGQLLGRIARTVLVLPKVAVIVSTGHAVIVVRRYCRDYL